MKIIKFTLILLTFSFLLFSCTNTVEKRRNIICLIDYSGTITEKTLNTYAKIMSKDILLNIGKYDKFTILPIDEGAKTEPVFLAHIDLSNHNFENATDGLTKKEELENDRVQEYLKKISDSTFHNVLLQKEIRKKYTKYTDLLNAIGQVSTKLEKTEKTSTGQEIWNGIEGNTTFDIENILVICSDMLQESKEFNFTSKKLTNEKLKQILLELKNSNRIPNLNNTVVFINGRTGKNNEIIDRVEYFWKGYFKETGAILKSYEFDSHYSIIEHLKNKSR